LKIRVVISKLRAHNKEKKRYYDPYILDHTLLVTIVDNHFIQIKSKNYEKALTEITQNLKWTKKPITQSALQEIQREDVNDIEIGENLFKNVYVFDLETYLLEDYRFELYATGYASLERIQKAYDSQENPKARMKIDPLSCVKTRSGKESFIQMINELDKIHGKITSKVVKNGKTVTQSRK